jgi:zinc transporter 1
MWYQDKKNIKLAIMVGLTLSFMVVEFVFGFMSSSLSLISDAFHMMSDVGALIIGIMARIYSKRENNEFMSYGYKRAEIVGGLVNGCFLVSVCFFMTIDAIQRYIEPQLITQPINIIIVGSIGLIINIIGLIMFHEHHHHHHHHHHEHNEGLLNHNHDTNLHGVFLHILGDALGSIGVVINGICVWIMPWNWKYYIDPTISIFICLLILKSSIPLIKYGLHVILQSVPHHIDLKKMKKEILEIEGVMNIHELHVWLLVDSTTIGSLHIQCLPETNFMELAQEIQDCMHRYHIHSITIQPEFIDKPQRCLISCEERCRKHKCCDD